MSSAGSVTHWIGLLSAGDEIAAQRLWERYFHRLVGLARKKLRGVRRRAADEEDVALSALKSFWRGVKHHRFPLLRDRDSLWPLLVVITARKAHDLRQFERRKKRGGGKVRGESALEPRSGAGSPGNGIEAVIGREPTPDFAVGVAEQCQRLLDRLPTAELRSIAVWKLESYTNAEIAAKVECVEGTVERKLRLIRSIWGKESVQ
jgi:DNA-directed RNA polymerase specialized sigma24 family protein